MLGQSISMVLPEVVGYKLTGKVNPLTTSTDIVLTITKVSIFCHTISATSRERVLRACALIRLHRCAC